MMNRFRKIAFGYATRCNIKCAHCVAADEEHPTTKMDLGKARTVIRALAGCHVQGVSFTAGEPLLFLDDIVDLIGICRRNEIYTRVGTNGFWAKTELAADRVVMALKVAGLSQLRISFSRWHQEHVPRDSILAAAESCKKAGLDYFISFVTDFSAADEVGEQFLRDHQLRFSPEPLIYLGRARKFDRPRIFTDFHPNTCPVNPYLSPDLDMFACCDAGSSFTKTNFFFLGNLKDQSLEALFQRYEKSRLINQIQTVGLTRLAASLGFKTREIVTYRRCELCEALFNSKENLHRLAAMVTSATLP